MVFGIAFSASAVSGQYRMTRLFMEYMDANDIRYSYKGVDSESGEEEITVSWDGENMSTIRLHFFFDEDEDICSIRVWNVIDFDPANLEAVVDLCDQMNHGYKFLTFYTDRDDNSVTASIDAILMDTDDCGKILFEYMYYMVSICDKVYPELKPLSR